MMARTLTASTTADAGADETSKFSVIGHGTTIGKLAR
jgi:hypothetical protein